MRNKSFNGDFGYTPDYYPNNGMGDWFSDLKKNIEREVQTFTKSFESDARDFLQRNTQSLPPEVRAQLEAEIKKGGAKSVDDLKKMAQQKMVEYAQQQAAAKAKDPAVQNKAIEAGVEATVKQVSNALISLKDLLIKGDIKGAYKQHPMIMWPPTIIGGLIGLKILVATGKFVYGKKMPAKANPFKKKRRFNKKFKIKKFK
jgi:hypothetical protein